MELLGNLEQGFAAWIYPNRVLIGLVVMIAIAGLVVLGWRRRWDRVARRHRGRTLLGLAIALAIAGPLGWYLGSPLFLSSSVDEAPPAVAAEATPSPTPSSPGAASPAPSAAIDQASPVTSSGPALIDRSGTFRGADEFHFGKGTARLIETAPGVFTVRLEDFAVRNGPDLFVYLSPSADGYTDGVVELGRLKADRGNQNYEVAAGTDASSVLSVVIWCKQFAVQFATAPLD